MILKNILLMVFFCSAPLFASLFGEDEPKEVVLPTHEIHLVGQSYFDEAQLQDALGIEHKSFFQFYKDDTPRIKDKLLPTLQLSLKSFYESEGFYDATFDIKETNTTVSVTISEGKPVKINDINISSDYAIDDLIKLKKGDIFRADGFIRSKAKIIARLLQEGYCSYELDAKAYVDLDAHQVDLRYVLHKGGVCTFGKVSIAGLENIDEAVVKSRVRAKEGERFSTDRVKETSEALYGLNAFDSVRIDVDRKFYNVVPVDIQLAQLQKEYHTEVGAGYDSYVGARVHGEVTKNNFLGNAQQLKLNAGWSQREQLLTLGYIRPALFSLLGYSIDLGATLGYSNLEFEGFAEEKAYTGAYLAYIDQKITLNTGVMAENIVITALDNLQSGQSLSQAVNEGTFNLFYPYIDFVYDARDSKLNPKYGYYLSAYTEFGLSQEEDSSVYYKSLFEGRLIHTFSDLTLAAVGKVGVVDEQTPQSLPESKYFFAGGSFFNRAYGFRELGVILSPTEYSIYGAATMANLSLEADYPVWGEVYGAVFTDNTMLTAESYDFSGEVITSAGVGVRYMTPIGPFKLDVGFNVQDASQSAISFQIGQSF